MTSSSNVSGLANYTSPIPSSSTPIIDNGSVYYIQLGAFEVKKFASFLAATFKDKGFPARSYKEPNQSLWRVRIGPWSNAEKAQEFVPRFSQEYPEAHVVVGKAKQF